MPVLTLIDTADESAALLTSVDEVCFNGAEVRDKGGDRMLISSTACRSASSATANELNFKYLSLVLLMVQYVVDAVAVRHSRTRTEDLFINSSAIVVIEGTKLVFSFVLLVYYGADGSFHGACRKAMSVFHGSDVDKAVQVAAIAFVYVIQNNLAFLAASHLDIATYQVTYQVRILTTALFSVTMLGRRLHPVQWISLGILVLGVVVVKLANLTPHHPSAHIPQLNMMTSSDGNGTSSTLSMADDENKISSHDENPLLGFGAVLLACVLSGFACVYFEKALKSGKSISLWLWNFQLSLISIPLSLAFSVATDWPVIKEKGFFFGYDAFVGFVLLNKSIGGLLIALVIKYADNIVKGFALSLSLVFLFVANWLFFGILLNVRFIAGAVLVVFSIFLYGYFPSPDIDAENTE